jgi:hypothetical protein
MSFGLRSAKDSVRLVQGEKHNLPYSREFSFRLVRLACLGLAGLKSAHTPFFKRLGSAVGLSASDRLPDRQ